MKFIIINFDFDRAIMDASNTLSGIYYWFC